MSSSYPFPTKRPLKIFAYDPMLGRLPLHRITVDVNYEALHPGPRGSRVSVIDYDGLRKRYYEPVNLDHPALLLNQGLDPTEADPRFHQQMVYAVAMKVIENFETALGRRFYFYGRKPLRLLPHAFQGANAYYSSRRHAVLFGYFPADMTQPGANIPGQNVFSCLSQDIVAHEVTHAVVDRLRSYFKWPTNPDMLAFHEGYSDIIAIFQHFSFPDILNHAIQETRGDLRQPTPLVELAAQFGQATGKGQALRTALDYPNAVARSRITEPHQRGSVLVAAVFDAFFTTFRQRTQDLLRIASGGTGRLPEGDLHPDLVNRLAEEARQTSRAVLRMCIRAFDYLPPVDITFGDYLRALVTADYELNPDDRSGLRRNMVEAFRIRGIHADRVSSLAEDALRWERADSDCKPFPPPVVDELTRRLKAEERPGSRHMRRGPDANAIENAADAEQVDDEGALDLLGDRLRQTAWESYAHLKMVSPARVRTRLAGMHPVFRIDQDGQLVVECVVQFVQEPKEPKSQYGGVAFRGGTTVVATSSGEIRYVIAKPLDDSTLDNASRLYGEQRRAQLEDFVHNFDGSDGYQIWKDQTYRESRLTKSLALPMIDRGVY